MHAKIPFWSAVIGNDGSIGYAVVSRLRQHRHGRINGKNKCSSGGAEGFPSRGGSKGAPTWYRQKSRRAVILFAAADGQSSSRLLAMARRWWRFHCPNPILISC
jgi:hypothetical protein